MHPLFTIEIASKLTEKFHYNHLKSLLLYLESFLKNPERKKIKNGERELERECNRR